MWPELEHLTPIIQNWCRWLLPQSDRQHHCLSLEHRYRSPQWGHWDESPPAISNPVDIIEAQAFEVLLRKLHWRQMQLIRKKYYYRWSDAKIAARLKIPRRDLQETHYFSLIALNHLIKTHGLKGNLVRDNMEFRHTMPQAA